MQTIVKEWVKVTLICFDFFISFVFWRTFFEHRKSDFFSRLYPSDQMYESFEYLWILNNNWVKNLIVLTKKNCNAIQFTAMSETLTHQRNTTIVKKNTVCERRNNFSGENPCTNGYTTSPNTSSLWYAHIKTTKPLAKNEGERGCFGQSLTIVIFFLFLRATQHSVYTFGVNLDRTFRNGKDWEF